MAEVLEIKGKTAKVKLSFNGEIKKIRLSSLKEYVPKVAHLDEQEIAHMSRTIVEGEHLYTFMNVDGTGGKAIYENGKVVEVLAQNKKEENPKLSPADLKSHRISEGLTQEAYAYRVGVRREAITRYENGSESIPA